MQKKRPTSDASFFPAADWIRRLAEETSAFDVTKVVETERQHRNSRKSEWDEVITISTKPDNRRVDLFVETRQQLSPATAMNVFQKLKWVPPDGVLVICAPYISPRVVDLCQEQNVGYLDRVGNCRITAPGLFVQISGRPNRQAAITAAVDPFSRKSSRIVRILLTHPANGWQVQQLAQQADVSLGLVSKVKKALMEDAYLEERDRLLYLRDPAKLLEGWAAQHRPHVKRRQIFALPRPAETEARLAQWCRANGISYALTQLSAAWRYAPMVRYDRSVVYIDKKVEPAANLRALLHHLDAREVDTGASCVLWITDDPAVFLNAREFEGVQVVSPLQLYLDLTALAGRGQDAAAEILEKELPALRPHARNDSERSQRGEQ